MPQTPATPALNLPGRVDNTNAIVVVVQAVALPLGPPTPFANLKLKTDDTGALVVTGG